MAGADPMLKLDADGTLLRSRVDLMGAGLAAPSASTMLRNTGARICCMTNPTTWLAIGFIGQAMFFMRFLVQWVAWNEPQDVVPRVFWYFSLSGGLVLLLYALHQRDPVFILGQATGLLIYIRNIMLSQPPAVASDKPA